MSKDTINPKRWILDEKQLEAIKNHYANELGFEQYCIKIHGKYVSQMRERQMKEYVDLYMKYKEANPCPLPNPVEIPSDETIDSSFIMRTWDKAGRKIQEAEVRGAKWLRDSIFNKQ